MININVHYDVIKWKHFPRNWPFVRRIHRSPVNSPHKGQWRRALMFPLICVWVNDWVNNREAGDLRRHLDHYDVSVMFFPHKISILTSYYTALELGHPFLPTGLTLIRAWISNYIYHEIWDEITYPFPNFNGTTVEIWIWISSFTPHILGHVITYPCWDYS